MKRLIALSVALTLTACGAKPAPLAVPHEAVMESGRSITNPSALQKHVMYFDGNGDGTVTQAETRAGLQAMGMSWLVAGTTALAIHVGLKGTAGSNSGLDLDITKIKFSKHANDTGAFDKDGNFVPSAFQRILTFDANHSGSLTWTELKAMIAANRQGQTSTFASEAEFGLLLKLGVDTTETENGTIVPALSTERLRGLYDGSLFYTIAGEHKQRTGG